MTSGNKMLQFIRQRHLIPIQQITMTNNFFGEIMTITFSGVKNKESNNKKESQQIFRFKPTIRKAKQKQKKREDISQK